MDVPADKLVVDFKVYPLDTLPLGGKFQFVAKVQFRAADGTLVDWPDGRVQVLYRGETFAGAGPHRVPADTVELEPGGPVAKLRVETWSDRRQRWVGTDIARLTTSTYCNADIERLSPEERALACLIFSEGGSSPDVKTSELHAVAWSVKNRLGLVERALAGTLGGGAKGDRRREEVLKYIGKQASYQAVISHPAQYSGYNNSQFKSCGDPERRIGDTASCRQVERCMQHAQDVVAGRTPDPYAGLGHPEFPGVFYYMTKGAFERLKSAGRKVPTMNRLPAFDASDRHLYWGLQARDPFEVP